MIYRDLGSHYTAHNDDVDDNADDDNDDDNDYDNNDNDNNPWSPGAPWEKPSQSENDCSLVFLNNLDKNILEQLKCDCRTTWKKIFLNNFNVIAEQPGQK